MKPSLLIRIYTILLLVIFGGIVVHAPFSVSMGVLFPDAELLVKSWKEMLLVVSSLFALLLVLQQKNWRELAKDRILQLAGLYMLLHFMIAAALLKGTLATIAGLMIDLRYIVFFVLVYILMKTAPGYRRRFLQVGAVGAILVVGFAVLQLFLPADILTHIGYGEHTIQPYLTVDKNPNFIRVNSTLRGPNPLGAYVLIVLGVLTAAVVRGHIDIRRRKKLLLTSLAAAASIVALWITYSRSALAGAGITVAVVVAVVSRRLISRRVWIIGMTIVFTLAGGIIASRDHPIVTNVLLHENRNGGSDVSSNDGHVSSVITATDKLLKQPFGGGIGSTGSASLMTDTPLIIENQYLFIAHEVGWLGLGLFLALFLLILVRLWRDRQDWLSLGVFASGVGLGLIGLLQPVWVDDTVSIIWWGLAALALGGGKHARNQTK